MNYFELYPGDYLRDTTRLSLAEHGAYLLLMADYYASERPLPAGMEALYRIVGAQGAAEQRAVRVVAERYFPVGDDGLRHNARADREIAKAAERMEGRAEKKGNETERQRRTRARRTKLFADLREVGVVPDGMTPMAELKALHTAHVTRDIAVTEAIVSRVTEAECHGVNTATRPHTPLSTTDIPPRLEELHGARKAQPGPLPPEVRAEAWDAYVQHQQAQRRGWSVARQSLALGDLRVLIAQGTDPNPVLIWATKRGLSDLADCARRMAADAAKETAHAADQPRPGAADSAAQRIREIAERNGIDLDA